jgi:hypothetical protein
MEKVSQYVSSDQTYCTFPFAMVERSIDLPSRTCVIFEDHKRRVFFFFIVDLTLCERAELRPKLAVLVHHEAAGDRWGIYVRSQRLPSILEDDPKLQILCCLTPTKGPWNLPKEMIHVRCEQALPSFVDLLPNQISKIHLSKSRFEETVPAC